MRAFLLGLTLLFSFQVYAGDIKDLNGKYTYLAFGENYKVTRYDLSIVDMKMDLPGDHAELKNIQIAEGGQDDFVATLKKGLPAGIKLYKAEADVQGAGQKMKLTLVVQSLDNKSPRLSVYAVLEGHPQALMKAYSTDQSDALNAAEAAMK